MHPSRAQEGVLAFSIAAGHIPYSKVIFDQETHMR